MPPTRTHKEPTLKPTGFGSRSANKASGQLPALSSQTSQLDSANGSSSSVNTIGLTMKSGKGSHGGINKAVFREVLDVDDDVMNALTKDLNALCAEHFDPTLVFGAQGDVLAQVKEMIVANYPEIFAPQDGADAEARMRAAVLWMQKRQGWNKYAYSKMHGHQLVKMSPVPTPIMSPIELPEEALPASTHIAAARADFDMEGEEGETQPSVTPPSSPGASVSRTTASRSSWERASNDVVEEGGGEVGSAGRSGIPQTASSTVLDRISEEPIRSVTPSSSMAAHPKSGYQGVYERSASPVTQEDGLRLAPSTSSSNARSLIPSSSSPACSPGTLVQPIPPSTTITTLSIVRYFSGSSLRETAGMRLFLRSCTPPMEHFLPRFLNFGCYNLQLLQAAQSWPADIVDEFLRSLPAGGGRAMTPMEVLVLRMHLVRFRFEDPAEARGAGM